jgi:hypothetical protein
MKSVFVCMILVQGFWSCASKEPNIRPIDAGLDARGTTGDQRVGINKQGDAVLQEQLDLGGQIRVLQHVNENLRMDVKSEFFLLKDCWKKRNFNTTKEMPELSGFDDFETPDSSKEEVGIVNDSLKVVKTEDAIVRMNSEKRTQTQLRANLKTVKSQKEKCEFESLAKSTGAKGSSVESGGDDE